MCFQLSSGNPKAYDQQALTVENGSFTPLVFSATGSLYIKLIYIHLYIKIALMIMIRIGFSIHTHA